MDATPKADRFPNQAPRGGMLSTVNGRFYRGGWFMPMLRMPAVAVTIPARTTIAGFAYAIRRLAIHPEVGTVAYAMDREDTGHGYMIHRDVFGEVLCTCPDAEMRRNGSGTPCKHGRALVELGLIPATTPRVLPPLRSRPAILPPPADEPMNPPLRRRRFEPTPEDCRMAAWMLARPGLPG